MKKFVPRIYDMDETITQDGYAVYGEVKLQAMILNETELDIIDTALKMFMDACIENRDVAVDKREQLSIEDNFEVAQGIRKELQLASYRSI